MKNKKLFAILTLVCFMFTLMPVAAFATPTDLDNTRSALFLADNQKNILTKSDTTASGFEETIFEVALRQVNSVAGSVTGTERLYIWATENGAVSPAVTFTATDATKADDRISKIDNVYAFATVSDKAQFKLEFARGGEFVIHAGFGVEAEDTLSDVKEFTTACGTVTVIDGAVNPDLYDMDITPVANVSNKGDVGYAYGDFEAYINNVIPNNVSEQYTLEFEETNGGNDLIGKTVTITSDSGNLTVTPANATTDVLGRVKINVSAAREGVYSIYVTVNGKTFVVGVNCGNTQAAQIETTVEPDNLIALFSSADDLVAFTVTDINGNAVKNLKAAGGADGLYGEDGKVQVKYLYFVEKPAASTLVNADLSLDETDNDGEYYLNASGKTLDAEGKYTVKAILDNGATATASWEVKRFETPVELVIDTVSNIELGKTFTPDLYYLDVNGVEKDAFDAKLAATGYAVYAFNGTTVEVKTDEKYAGKTITLTASSELYDLVAVKEVKVAAEAVAIEFAEDTLDVDVNNKVKWNVVDEEGNKISLTDVAAFDVEYVVLDKPEDAKVSVYDLTPATFTGEGKMALTSDKVGNVTVQVIAQVQVAEDATVIEYTEKPVVDADGHVYYVVNGVTYPYATWSTWANLTGATVLTEKVPVPTAGVNNIQTKYYTGTEVFAVGTESKGDVVVMSIGSTEIVINDEVSDMGVAPIIENGRTFVPYRAGLEALGATVAYDEATQAVSAEMNGVTVVMTIGSNVYTINGVEHTMDVAPFISESRTMVPARFAAQAFGITVIPTQNPDGTTADVLYIM